jgi:XTP/dITP diphosphohydrolase
LIYIDPPVIESLSLKLLLATRNEGKVREQVKALAGSGIEVVSLDKWPDLPSPEETGSTFLENAIAKAKYYNQNTGVASVAEDAGLEVDALGGAPGVLSSRWMGEETSYETKNAWLVEHLSKRPTEERTARYVAAIALADEGEVIFTAEETCEGRVALEPRGNEGFGYDPVFYYPPFGKTFGEATPEEKNRVSHRGKTMVRLREFLDRIPKSTV